jgi:hypothetical protein
MTRDDRRGTSEIATNRLLEQGLLMNPLGPLKAVQRQVGVTRKAVARRLGFHENQPPAAGEPTHDEVEEAERNSFHTASVTQASIDEAQRGAADYEDPQLHARVEEAQRGAANDEDPQRHARVEEAQRGAANDEDPQLHARVEEAQRGAEELIDAGRR